MTGSVQNASLHATDIEAAISDALQRLKSNDLHAAESMLRSVVGKEPSHVGALTNLGALLGRLGRFEEAVEMLRRAAALAPEHAAIHYNLGNAYRGAGRNQDAADAYRAALQRDPTLAAAFTNLGNTLVDLRQVTEAADAYESATALTHAPGPAARPLPAALARTSSGKVDHDIEQFEYLNERGRLGAQGPQLVELFREARAALPPAPAGTHVVDLPEPWKTRLRPFYNRLVHRAEAPRLGTGAVSPNLDDAAITRDYFERRPGMTFVDGFLTPQALASLRRFCLESTVWFQYRYANGYLGAFWQSGFWAPLLHQIAEELRAALPAIFQDHALRKVWAFKYDARLSGIPIHADFAAVNVNFWITPDEANLDPRTGGLIIWDKEAPAAWDFETYNADERAIRGFLADSQAASFDVPYRANRAVIFNSDLFHETASLHFRPGYANRRINITMLFGKRISR
jgi:tetratricopeptide (TPR) repeat protein